MTLIACPPAGPRLPRALPPPGTRNHVNLDAVTSVSACDEGFGTGDRTWRHGLWRTARVLRGRGNVSPEEAHGV